MGAVTKPESSVEVPVGPQNKAQELAVLAALLLRMRGGLDGPAAKDRDSAQYRDVLRLRIEAEQTVQLTRIADALAVIAGEAWDSEAHARRPAAPTFQVMAQDHRHVYEATKVLDARD